MPKLPNKLHVVMEAMHDCARPTVEIAQELGISTREAAQRITSLRNKGLVEKVGQVEYQAPGGSYQMGPTVRPTALGFAYLGEHVYRGINA